MFRFPTKGGDKEDYEVSALLGNRPYTVTNIWVERYEDVVSLTYISNYCREDVGASACCLSLNRNAVEGYR